MRLIRRLLLLLLLLCWCAGEEECCVDLADEVRDWLVLEVML
jgi:hypothetical protein